MAQMSRGLFLTHKPAWLWLRENKAQRGLLLPRGTRQAHASTTPPGISDTETRRATGSTDSAKVPSKRAGIPPSKWGQAGLSEASLPFPGQLSGSLLNTKPKQGPARALESSSPGRVRLAQRPCCLRHLAPPSKEEPVKDHHCQHAAAQHRPAQFSLRFQGTQAPSSPGGAQLCAHKTDRKAFRYADKAEEVHAEIWSKSYEHSGEGMNQRYTQHMMFAKWKKPDWKAIYFTIPRVCYSYKGEALGRNQTYGCRGWTGKGGSDYRRTCRNLGTNSVLSWLWWWLRDCVHLTNVCVKPHLLCILSQQKKEQHWDEFNKMQWDPRKGTFIPRGEGQVWWTLCDGDWVGQGLKNEQEVIEETWGGKGMTGVEATSVPACLLFDYGQQRAL